MPLHTAIERTQAPALVEIYREAGHLCYGRSNVVIVYSADDPDSAYMFEGQGFAASAKRSAFTFLNLAAPLPFPVKVASTPLDAATKLVEMLERRSSRS